MQAIIWQLASEEEYAGFVEAKVFQPDGRDYELEDSILEAKFANDLKLESKG